MSSSSSFRVSEDAGGDGGSSVERDESDCEDPPVEVEAVEGDGEVRPCTNPVTAPTPAPTPVETTSTTLRTVFLTVPRAFLNDCFAPGPEDAFFVDFFIIRAPPLRPPAFVLFLAFLAADFFAPLVPPDDFFFLAVFLAALPVRRFDLLIERLSRIGAATPRDAVFLKPGDLPRTVGIDHTIPLLFNQMLSEKQTRAFAKALQVAIILGFSLG